MVIRHLKKGLLLSPRPTSYVISNLSIDRFVARCRSTSLEADEYSRVKSHAKIRPDDEPPRRTHAAAPCFDSFDENEKQRSNTEALQEEKALPQIGDPETVD